VSSVVVNAQEKAPTPRVEVGLTYGFTRVNPGGNAADFTQNGGSGQVEYNMNRPSSSSATISPSITVSSGSVLSALTTSGYRPAKSLSFRERS
jgi:hypothetical protein